MQGVVTTVNLPTVLTVLTIGSLIGGIVWRLSGTVSSLKGEIELLKNQLKAQADHYDQKMDKVDTDIKHTLETLNLKLKYSDEADKRIELQIGTALIDLKTLTATISKIETAALVAQAVSKGNQSM